MDKDRTMTVCRISAAVLFALAGIIYVATIREKEQYREFPLSKNDAAEYVSRADYGFASQNSTSGENITEEPVITPLLVNINTAEAGELMLLPGIGEKKAAAIVEYRDTQGTFSVKEDIMLVPGIKDGIFSKIQEYIYVEEEVSDAQEDSGG